MSTPNHTQVAPQKAILIQGAGVGGDHVERVTVAWASDARPLTVEFNSVLLSPERIREIWSLLENALAEDPTPTKSDHQGMSCVRGNEAALERTAVSRAAATLRLVP